MQEIIKGEQLKAGVIIEKNGNAESRDMFLSNRGEFECGLDKAEGAYVFDKDGKNYIDYNLGSGTFILGHGDSEVKKWQHTAVDRGALFVGGCSGLENLENLIRNNHSYLENFALATTGTEAVLRAIRMARHVTRREKIVVLEGCWHGSMDYTLYKGNINSKVEKISEGLPDTYQGTLVMGTDGESLEWLRNQDNIGAVIMEPIRGSWPIEPTEAWKEELQDICINKGIVLILDEVISGHRYSKTGVYEKYNKCSTLVCFGKAMGGGCPISMVGSNKIYNEQFGAGLTKTIESGKIVLGGTFTGNPLSTASAIGVQTQIKQCSDLYPRLKETGEYLRYKLNHWCTENRIEAGVVGTNSINKLVCRKEGKLPRSFRERDEFWDSKVINQIKSIMREKGILIGGNNLLFTSYRHSKELIDETIERLEKGNWK